MANSVPPNWYPDPSRRFELRYWDGAQWSDHVVSQSRTYVDPLIPGSAPTAAHMPKTRGYDAKIGRQVRKAKVEGPNLRRGGTLLTESVLVINQKPKRHEFLVEYEVFSREGGKLGEIRETGFGFVLPALTGKSDEERKRKLEVVDSSGTVLYRLKQTVTSIRSRVTLSYPDGKKVGKFIQKGLINRKLILQGRSSDVGHVAIEDWHIFSGNSL